MILDNQEKTNDSSNNFFFNPRQHVKWKKQDMSQYCMVSFVQNLSTGKTHLWW